MQNYLEPVDDGLAMRPSGRWVTEKLHYLKTYVDIFEISMRNKWGRRNFIDLFAGPGKCRTETGAVFLGSPLVALTTKYPFTGYYFVDTDSDYVEALKTRAAASPSFSNIRFGYEDGNNAVHTIIQDLQASDLAARGASLNLAFLDPDGLELHWSTVAALAAVPKMDLIIHYPVMGLKREIENASQSTNHRIDLFFGDRTWRDTFQKRKDPSIVEQELLASYKGKLSALGYVEIKQDDETSADPAIKNTKGGLLYRLLFASKHSLGDKFWKAVTKRDIHGQGRLF